MARKNATKKAQKRVELKQSKQTNQSNVGISNTLKSTSRNGSDGIEIGSIDDIDISNINIKGLFVRSKGIGLSNATISKDTGIPYNTIYGYEKKNLSNPVKGNIIAVIKCIEKYEKIFDKYGTLDKNVIETIDKKGVNNVLKDIEKTIDVSKVKKPNITSNVNIGSIEATDVQSTSVNKFPKIDLDKMLIDSANGKQLRVNNSITTNDNANNSDVSVNIEIESNYKSGIELKRWGIYYIKDMKNNIGHEIKGGRPAIVIEPDFALKSGSLVVKIIYLTTKPKKPMITHVNIASSNVKSIAVCEQINSIDVCRIDKYVGMCTRNERSEERRVGKEC